MFLWHDIKYSCAWFTENDPPRLEEEENAR